MSNNTSEIQIGDEANVIDVAKEFRDLLNEIRSYLEKEEEYDAEIELLERELEEEKSLKKILDENDLEALEGIKKLINEFLEKKSMYVKIEK